MPVNLSPAAGAAAQFFTDNGVPLAGGLIYTYAAGTTTPQAAYTSSTGGTAWSNPIVLNSAGRVSGGGEIWLTEGAAYKFVLYNANSVLIATYDQISGVNDQTNLLAFEALLAGSTGSSLVGFLQAGVSAVATTVQAKLRQTVSVMDFGAVGNWNGTTGTDNTAAFNAALAYLKSTNGGKLLVPFGNYYCTGLVGNAPQTITDWNHNTEIVGDQGATLTFLGTYNGTCVSLNGSNVAIRNLIINSTRTINYRGNLVTQRTPYQLGIIIGGKIGVGTINTFQTNAQVTNCQIYNMNEPITATMAGQVIISDCVVNAYTDTGIMIQDCTTDIWVERNKVTEGGDDSIFVRHYATTPWAIAGNYIGRVHISDNFLNDTFGKNIGVAGYGDVEISGNYCGLSYAGGINLEKDDWAQTNTLNFRNYQIWGNTIVNPGRNWNTSYTVYNTAASGANPSGIQTVYLNTYNATYNYTNVNIRDNIIVNPYYDAIALAVLNYVYVTGNTWTQGTTNHGAGNVNSQGVMCDVYSSITNLFVSNNKTSLDLGVTPAYTHSVASGGGTTTNIYFANNFDLFTTEAVTYADGPARTATTFSVVHYGDQGTVTFSAATTAAVTLTRYQPDTNYRISLGGNAAGYTWVTAKTTSGFTLNCSILNSNATEWILGR